MPLTGLILSSSRPPAHTTIGVLARIVADIEFALTFHQRFCPAHRFNRETSLFKPVMKPESPMWEFLRCISEHGERDSVPVWIHEETSKSDPDFDTVAEKFASMSLINRHLIETSKALTVVNGGVKVCLTHTFNHYSF
jgi:Gly-Xaa carboxypeptidase